jgi:hypothetical protein
MNMNATAQMRTTTQVGCGKAKKPEHAAGKAQELGDPSEHVFLFDVCQKCGISAFNLDDDETCTVINNQHAADNAQLAMAFGPNDECIQIGGLSFMVNISAQLIADKINASINAERERYRKLVDAERRRCFDLEQQLAAEREK